MRPESRRVVDPRLGWCRLDGMIVAVSAELDARASLASLFGSHVVANFPNLPGFLNAHAELFHGTRHGTDLAKLSN